MVKVTFQAETTAELLKSIEDFMTVGSSTEPAPQQKEPVEEKETVTLKMVKALAKQKMDEKKSKAIKVLLGEFDAEKLDEIEESRLGEFYGRLEEL